MRRTRSSLNQETPSQKNPGCDGTGGSSVPELRVFIRRKRVKKTVEVIAKEVKEESSGKKVMVFLNLYYFWIEMVVTYI